MTVADALMLWAIERVYPSDFTSRKQSIRKLEKSRFWGFHMNALIYKGTFGNKGFENKKLTLLGVV